MWGGEQAISLSYQLIHMLPCDESTPCVVCHQLDHKDWSFNQTIKDDHVASDLLCVYLAEMDSSHHLLLPVIANILCTVYCNSAYACLCIVKLKQYCKHFIRCEAICVLHNHAN